MTRQEIQKLALENAELKRLLHQRDKKVDSLKSRIDELSKDKKALKAQNERSKNKASALKTALLVEQKKTLFEQKTL